MDFRIDSATGYEWRDARAQTVISAPIQTRQQLEANLRLEFAEKLTRLSAVLGVLTHLVRVNDLRDEERSRFDQSVKLAEQELSQASDAIRDTRRINSGASERTVDVRTTLTTALNRLRERMLEEGIDCDLDAISATAECDGLALKSLFIGMLQYAIQTVKLCNGMAKRFTARVTTDTRSIHFIIQASGPAYANPDLVRGNPLPESSKACLDRCMQLASVLGGSLSIRYPIQSEGLTMRFEMPKHICTTPASIGSISDE